MAAASSTKNAGTVVDVGAAWANEAATTGASDATGTDDTNAATSNDITSGPSGTLRWTNFGFAIPANATITSVRAAVFGRRRTVTDGTPFGRPTLYGGGGVLGSTLLLTTGFATSYGSTSKDEYDGDPETSDWNVSGGLAPADVNDSGFGFQYFFSVAGASTPENRGIDYVELEIAYTTPDGDTTTAFRRGRGRSRMRGLA